MDPTGLQMGRRFFPIALNFFRNCEASRVHFNPRCSVFLDRLSVFAVAWGDGGRRIEVELMSPADFGLEWSGRSVGRARPAGRTCGVGGAGGLGCTARAMAVMAMAMATVTRVVLATATAMVVIVMVSVRGAVRHRCLSSSLSRCHCYRRSDDHVATACHSGQGREGWSGQG